MYFSRLLLSFILLNLSLALPADIQCLRNFKSSVQDPQGYLRSWNFSNTTKEAYICNFLGVTCLHPNESKVYGLSLPGGKLGGSFPSGLNACSSLTTLDLSGNTFTGPIPDQLCKMLPFLVKLDISQNRIGGSIPAGLGNCTYLNVLKLQMNQLNGSIPGPIGLLPRLKDLDVSDNNLSGVIPYTFSNFSAVSFARNRYLCGRPLVGKGKGKCKRLRKKGKSSIAMLAGVAGGGILGIGSIAGICIWCILMQRKKPLKRAMTRDQNDWVKRIKAPNTIGVDMFEKPARLKLADLMVATKDFSKENILGSCRTGTVYKALLGDGTMICIKRLSVSAQGDRQFRAEMDTLGKLRHPNLVPLLGYCVAGSEKLLVYEPMSKGSLYDCLHGDGIQKTSLDWPTRLKIAIGAARGLAWLHHSCNPRVIHRNISAYSILLDDNMEAKIADFGLARLMNPVDTHISTFVNGDFGDVGYVAPEYVRTLVATVKGDVYSFGVVLLELITGHRAAEVSTEDEFRGNLAEWVAMLSANNRLPEALDPMLSDQSENEDEFKQMRNVACSCVLSSPKERPSMYEVFQLLKAIGAKYNFTDENDQLPILPETGDDFPELIVVKTTGNELRG